jgi:hypothetical protein
VFDASASHDRRRLAVRAYRSSWSADGDSASDGADGGRESDALSSSSAALNREKAERQDAAFLLVLARVVLADVVFSVPELFTHAALDRELDQAIGTIWRARRRKASGSGRQPYAIADAQFEAVADRSLREAAQTLGVSRSVVHRWRLSRKPADSRAGFASESSTIQPTARDVGCHADR